MKKLKFIIIVISIDFILFRFILMAKELIEIIVKSKDSHLTVGEEGGWIIISAPFRNCCWHDGRQYLQGSFSISDLLDARWNKVDKNLKIRLLGFGVAKDEGKYAGDQWCFNWMKNWFAAFEMQSQLHKFVPLSHLVTNE
jgi:hypothetical protein